MRQDVTRSVRNAKMRKATVSFEKSVCLSVCPSVRMEQLGSHGTDFREFWHLSTFRNL